jgi:hypothetical protein
MPADSGGMHNRRAEMAKKGTKIRLWTWDDIRTLKSLAREDEE